MTGVIYLVRHGETEWNVAGRLQGQLNSPLTVTGMGQARASARLLKRELATNNAEADRIGVLSSPRGRALETARAIAVEVGLAATDIRTSELLAEHHMGRWAGLTFDEIERQFPGARAARRADAWRYVVPDGESYELLLRRAVAWLAEPPLAPITIAVTHELTSKTIRGAYVGLTPDEILLGSHRQDRIYRLAGGRIEELAC